MRRLSTSIILTAFLSACSVPDVENNAGDWEISAFCPATDTRQEVLFRGIAELEELRPNEFRGTYGNNFGDFGTLTAFLDGDTLDAELIWRNGNRMTALLRRQGDINTYAGQDDMGCFVQAKRPGL